MAEYKVIDNFLPNDVFDKILCNLYQADISWKCNHCTSNDLDVKGDFYFIHMIYHMTIKDEKSIKTIGEILDKLNIKALIRVKMNLYTRTEFLQHHKDHTDYPYTHKGALFSLNTCDGCTVIDGKEIASVANRMVFFDPSIRHHSTNCTNAPHRMNINFNYF